MGRVLPAVIFSLLLCLSAQPIFAMESVQVSELSHRAHQLQMQGEYDKALAVYPKLVELDPDNSATVYDMGTCYQAAGNLDSAINCFEIALQKDSKNGDCRAALNMAKHQKADPLTSDGVKALVNSKYVEAALKFKQSLAIIRDPVLERDLEQAESALAGKKTRPEPGASIPSGDFAEPAGKPLAAPAS